MAKKKSVHIDEIYYSQTEKEETILFLNSFLYYESEHKTGNASTTHCYVKETIKMLNESNVLRCDDRFFKYFNRDSGDDCKRDETKVPSKRSAVIAYFKGLNERMISYFDVNYNRNHNFKISIEGFYVKVGRIPNIVEVLRDKGHQEKQASNKTRSSVVLDYQDIFDIYKWINLLLILFLPIKHTVRRFSNIELVSTSLAFHLLGYLSAKKLFENAFQKILSSYNVKELLASAGKDKKEQFQLMTNGLIDTLNMLVDINNILTLLLAIMLSTLIFVIANKMYKFSRATYGGLFFIFLNTYSIVLFVFGLISYQLLSPNGHFKVPIMVLSTAYFVIYPVASTKFLLNLKFRESIGAYVVLLFLVGIFRYILNIVF
ncbi:hypothetical protein [Seleniivibrio woodruffii]|uniref:Uncharacterized protein n=1 Tax=Seleniivibrio woodruffii TaxID=1078050 RepID=A0A4R1KAT0_9BACT|nr:hypothetical protein [Seleniivibrio woodruffii]TCK61542.1 hypothetical protein C8D98_0043 [Seleniivibrio woodruffii]TVZ35343.1 hypothetical protein OF66_0950 [Seleniivibrio woodruffii]